MSIEEPFVRSTPPVEIPQLPYVSFRGYARGIVETAIWSYFPTREERALDGLRIELYRGPDGSGEARLVKGDNERPKHLQVVRLRRFTAGPIQAAVDQLVPAYFAKGW
jgi:hypothetical protein